MSRDPRPGWMAWVYGELFVRVRPSRRLTRWFYRRYRDALEQTR